MSNYVCWGVVLCETTVLNTLISFLVCRWDAAITSSGSLVSVQCHLIHLLLESVIFFKLFVKFILILRSAVGLRYRHVINSLWCLVQLLLSLSICRQVVWNNFRLWDIINILSLKAISFRLFTRKMRKHRRLILLFRWSSSHSSSNISLVISLSDSVNVVTLQGSIINFAAVRTVCSRRKYLIHASFSSLRSKFNSSNSFFIVDWILRDICRLLLKWWLIVIFIITDWNDNVVSWLGVWSWSLLLIGWSISYHSWWHRWIHPRFSVLISIDILNRHRIASVSLCIVALCLGSCDVLQYYWHFISLINK